MITLLSGFFIKNKENVQDPAVRQAYGILCGALGIALNLLLFAGKFIAGLLSGSIAITADAFNNLSDAGSSVITLIGFRMAGQKPDPGHPFGHGRIEYLSGLFVSIAILLMAAELIKTSFDKILHPEAISCSLLVVAILLISILVKLYMAFYNHSVSKKIGSAAMSATATDSLSDTLSTSVVLATTLCSHFTSLRIDGYCGILVGFFIFFAGIKAAKDTISPLLGQPPEPEFVKKIETIVMSHESVLGIHDLIVHDYGPGRLMISLHAEVPADGDILTLHDLIDNIEHELHRRLQCEAVIHMDPICTNDAETLTMKECVKKILRNIDSRLSLHDFRIVAGPTHTNLIFDIVVPYKFEYSDAQIVERIQKEVGDIDGRYYAVIDVDHNYSA